MSSPSVENAAILLVEDDIPYRESIRDALTLKGYRVQETASVAEATRIIEKGSIDLVLLDLQLPVSSGMAFLRKHQDRLQEMMVIVLTGHAGSKTAIEAIQLGAFDYLTKGGDLDELRLLIQRAVQHRHLVLQTRKSDLRDPSPAGPEPGPLIGTSPAILNLCKRIGQAAATDASVLITGESGTGKELVARAIQDASRRKDKPYVAFNCPAVPESLAESILFGVEKGVATDVDPRPGKFEEAHMGTLLLDEVGDLSLPAQAKLLRVLQERLVERVGGRGATPVDVRVLAATNKDLPAAIKAGGFREDLYYRLKVLEFKMPPLRDHRVDIPQLVNHFLESWAKANQRKTPTVSSEALSILSRHSWPGNIRELRNVVEQAASLAWGDAILPEVIQQALQSEERPPEVVCGQDVRPLADVVVEAERGHIAWVLVRVGWCRHDAADLLKIDRKTLYQKMKRYGITGPGE